MAFLDLSDVVHTATAPAPAVASAKTSFAVVDVAGSFSSLEHRVVELARGEGLDSLRAPRKRSWLGRLILGPTPPSKILANEQLEALRRLAVQAWHHGYTLPFSALGEAKKAGYSESQVGWVVDTIGRQRAQVRRVAG